MIGRTLGGYQIVEQVGMGGMATVYKAYDSNTDRFVALKILPEHYGKDSEFYERFRREAKAIARLEHLHILPVHGYGEENGTAYLVMRYLPTGTLASRIRQGPKLSFDEIIRLLEQIASALDYAHEQGVLHRDVKPSNVLLDQKGNAYLTDFGIARMVESTSDLTGTRILGTPQYMSPEQCQGVKDLTPAVDIYALGVVLFEMVTGQVPFQAETPLAVIYMQLNTPLPPPKSLRPDLPDDAERVILKALSKQPEQRPKTCLEMARAFRQAVTVQQSSAPTAPALSSMPNEKTVVLEAESPSVVARTSNRGGLIIGGAAVVAILAVVAVLSGQFTPAVTPQSASVTMMSATVDPDTSIALAATDDLPSSTDSVTPTDVQTEVIAASTDTASPNPTEISNPTATNEPTDSANETEIAVEIAAASISDAVVRGDDYWLQGQFEQAAQEYQRAIDEDAGLASAYLGLGRVYSVQYQPEAAITQLDEALKLDPTLVEALYYRGLAHHSLGNYEAATLDFAEVIELDEQPVFLVARGNVFTDMGDYEAAVADYERAVEVDPNYVDAYIARGNVNRAIGVYDNAFEDYAQALSLDSPTLNPYERFSDPVYVRVVTLLRRSDLYIETGQYDLALADFDVVLDIDEGYTEGYLGRAAVFTAMGDFDQAFEAYERALALAPDWSGIYFDRGQLYLTVENYENAVNDFTQALELSGEAYHVAYTQRGYAYLGLEDYQAAIRDFDASISIESTYNPEAFTGRGMGYAGLGDSEAALADFATALEQHSGYALAYEQRGVLLAAQGDYESALADFSTAIELNPVDWWLYYDRAGVYAAQGDTERAIVEYTTAIAQYEDFYEAYMERGQLYFNQENFDAALVDWNRAIEIDPSLIWGYVNRSQIHVEREDYEAAFADLELAITLEGEDVVYAYSALGDLYYDLERFEEAHEAYRVYLDLIGEDAEPYVLERYEEYHQQGGE